MREVDMGNDRDLFTEDSSGFPVFEGRMIGAYDYRAKAYVSGRGRSAVWKNLEFGDPEKSSRAQWYIPEQELPGRLGNRTNTFRIGFCDVASPTAFGHARTHTGRQAATNGESLHHSDFTLAFLDITGAPILAGVPIPVN